MENLIFKKAYTVETGVPIRHSFDRMGHEHPEGLTDDSAPSLDYTDKGWSQFYRGLSRSITVALDGEFAVNGFEITFLHNKFAGIYSPCRVELHVSENGRDFMPAYVVDSLVTPSDSEVKTSLFCLKDAARYRASFVRLVFDTDVNVFAHGFKVYGGECDGTEMPVVISPLPDKKSGMREQEDGYSSTCIIYHGYWDSTMSYGERYVKNTVEMLLPYVGYMNADGEITDTMFDSIVFLFLQSRTPSGGKTVFFGCDDKNATVKNDYDVLAENLFLDDFNMGALEKAFGIVKEKLGLDPERRLNVSVQLPFPYKTTRPFGDINGDGIDEGSYSIEERIAACEYYIDKVIADFNARAYKNLRLAAFYQGCESVPVAMSDDEFKLFSGVNAIVHSRGLKATWIPCFLGNGFEKWRELGFDFAYLQPNYMFHDFEPEALEDFAEILDTYGLGAEIEINGAAVAPSSDKFDYYNARYADYLDYGAATGYMNAALAFYQGAGPGSYYTAAHSDDERARNVYDSTYRFIKGTYIPKTINEEENTMDENNALNEETVEEAVEEVEAVEEAEAAEAVQTTKPSVKEVAAKAVKQVADAAAQAKDTVEKTAAQAKEKAALLKGTAEAVVNKTAEKARDTSKKTADAVKKGKEAVTAKVKELPEDKALAAVSVFGALVAVIGALCGGNDDKK